MKREALLLVVFVTVVLGKGNNDITLSVLNAYCNTGSFCSIADDVTVSYQNGNGNFREDMRPGDNNFTIDEGTTSVTISAVNFIERTVQLAANRKGKSSTMITNQSS